MILIQHDWRNVLRDPGSNVWVLHKDLDGKAHHAFIYNKDGFLKGDGDFSATLNQNSSLNVQYKNHRSVFISPEISFPNIHERNCTCMDISEGGLGISSSDSDLKIWDLISGDIRRVLKGHLSDIYTCKFFPSGIVILSGGSDMLLKIWSADTGECAATLMGHKGSIMDTCIVDRGRNIISVSKDQSAKLWDCGKSTVLAELYQHDDVINCCCLLGTSGLISLGLPMDISNREVGTADKLLIIGCNNNSVVGVACRSRGVIFNFQCDESVNCLSCFDKEICVGLQSGKILLLDHRNTTKPVQEWHETRSPAKSLYHSPKISFVSHQDGTCHSLVRDGNNIQIQLSGSDCDAINQVCGIKDSIFTCCRDGILRKYSLSL